MGQPLTMSEDAPDINKDPTFDLDLSRAQGRELIIPLKGLAMTALQNSMRMIYMYTKGIFRMFYLH